MAACPPLCWVAFLSYKSETFCSEDVELVMSSTFQLLVNGQSHRVSVDYDDTPLLYVLRDDLKLKGVRFGCGVGQCGACTVIVDGRAERSCELPVWSLEGKAITTIEGLGSAEAM